MEELGVEKTVGLGICPDIVGQVLERNALADLGSSIVTIHQ